MIGILGHVDVDVSRAGRSISRLDDAQLDQLVVAGEQVEFPAGCLLQRERTPASCCLVILDGRAEVSVRGEVVEVVGRGAVLGAEPGRPALMSARTVMPVRALRIAGDAQDAVSMRDGQ